MAQFSKRSKNIILSRSSSFFRLSRDYPMTRVDSAQVKIQFLKTFKGQSFSAKKNSFIIIRRRVRPMLLAAADPNVSDTPITAPASSDLAVPSPSAFACGSSSSCSVATSCQLADAMLSVKFT